MPALGHLHPWLDGHAPSLSIIRRNQGDLHMIVDSASIIDLQLTAAGPTDLHFPDGRSTPIRPGRQTPCPDGRALSLDGAWRAARWPFAEPEARLVSPAASDAAWPVATQPGKVLYADPAAESAPIPKWNRVDQAHIHDEDGAVIRRRAAVPKEWAGKRIILRFDAIFPAGRVYLDGDLLGEHTSGLTPVEYDITARVAPGQEFLVAVRLLRKHTFLKMDMVRHGMEFAGLAQPACIFAVEDPWVEDYRLPGTLSAKLDTGTVAGEVLLRGQGGTVATLALSLADAAGKTVASCQARATIPAGGRVQVPLTLELASPALWNDECPNLYTARLVLSAPGRPDQSFSWRTGFRRLDLRPEGPLLNGSFIKFRGVNHLTYHPEHGMHTPREWLRRCLSLMKKANVNCIRTHYLGPRDLADLCDELGLYLLQELPIDWGTNYIHDPEWVGPALQRIEGGVRRDRHHPSVMVWSIGNENLPENAAVAEDGWNHLRTYDRFCKALDPSRPTMFPPPGPANAIKGIFEVRVGDIADTHYSFNLQKEFLATGKLINPRSWAEGDFETCTREEALARGWSGVWFSSEYGLTNTIPDLLNAPYLSIIDDQPEDLLGGKNSLQAFMDRLEREWGHMRAERTCLGGAYFPWLCAGAGDNPWGWVRWGEDADWGIVTADLLPKPQFWGLRVAFSPVRFPARAEWKAGADHFEVEIDNQFNGLDLADCVLRTQQSGGSIWMGMVRQFRDVPVRCAPGGRVKVRVPVWDEGMKKALESGNFGRCCFHLLKPDGFRVITADTLVFPARLEKVTDGAMRVGPDAPMTVGPDAPMGEAGKPAKRKPGRPRKT